MLNTAPLEAEDNPLPIPTLSVLLAVTHPPEMVMHDTAPLLLPLQRPLPMPAPVLLLAVTLPPEMVMFDTAPLSLANPLPMPAPL